MSMWIKVLIGLAVFNLLVYGYITLDYLYYIGRFKSRLKRLKRSLTQE